MEFYASRWREINSGFWMSFENNPRLEETKKNIYIRCLPCLEKLFEQLAEEPHSLLLEEPLNCWKVIVVLNSVEECLELLDLYQEEKFPVNCNIRGRVGSRDKNSSSVVVLFHMLDEDVRDKVMSDVKELTPEINPSYSLFYERGCQDTYGVLCGDWSTWGRETPVKNREQIPVIREKVNKLLKGQY